MAFRGFAYLWDLPGLVSPAAKPRPLKPVVKVPDVVAFGAALAPARGASAQGRACFHGNAANNDSGYGGAVRNAAALAGMNENTISGLVGSARPHSRSAIKLAGASFGEPAESFSRLFCEKSS